MNNQNITYSRKLVWVLVASVIVYLLQMPGVDILSIGGVGGLVGAIAKGLIIVCVLFIPVAMYLDKKNKNLSLVQSNTPKFQIRNVVKLLFAVIGLVIVGVVVLLWWGFSHAQF